MLSIVPHHVADGFCRLLFEVRSIRRRENQACTCGGHIAQTFVTEGKSDDGLDQVAVGVLESLVRGHLKLEG